MSGILPRKIMDKSEIEIRVRPVVWVALAAAVCVVLAAVVGRVVTDRRPLKMAAVPDATTLTRPPPPSVGPAFVAKSGEISSYRGRTNVKVVWNFSQNAPELIVEAFPWED